ncbi:AroE1 [Desulforapulum autotrophicum HRM2]|uniref:Shikimate dehydrogenase (NADP(+)) n=1 Tax=Desulforapulum autotrophicum (strain ATCC 43914 / DSM 3382 / VKM B-1955 / HRM2) TaxID=177437 RepID=C0QEK5_DESAH|nr:shikimate dehydrogenase [Desulforapulum autotrophicum]ACN15347.1 AroE1 [Desulforapulum autotrophicum HRM2]
MLNSDTRLYALFGDPVAHSLGPVMHNAAFQKANINGVYLAFRVPRIDDAIASMKALGIAGASVTIPHKETVIPLLDRIDPLARGMGAVNTIINRDGMLFGYNTDCMGAVDPLEGVCDLKGRRVVVLGAGGAARAVAFGIRQQGAIPFIVNRSIKRGRTLADELGAAFIPKADIATVDPDIIVNATAIGMAPDNDAIPLDPEILKPGMVVMDIVYTPVRTALIKAAAERGCTVIDGMAMFVNQGALQFELFTGKKAPIQTMKSVLLKALEKR